MSSILDDDDDSTSPISNLQSLSTSLSDLDKVLAPLLDRPLKDTLGALEDHLQKAKMGIMLAYSICDLIWIFLRTRGIDAADHPVMRELDRIKGYYLKVKEAEAAASGTQQQRTQIDVPAAARFIKHSIGSPKERTVQDRTQDQEPLIEVGMHSRFKHINGTPENVKKAIPGSNSESNGEELDIIQSDADEERKSSESDKKKGKRPASALAQASSSSPSADGSPVSASRSTRTSGRATAASMMNEDAEAENTKEKESERLAKKPKQIGSKKKTQGSIQKEKKGSEVDSSPGSSKKRSRS